MGDRVRRRGCCAEAGSRRVCASFADWRGVLLLVVGLIGGRAARIGPVGSDRDGAAGRDREGAVDVRGAAGAARGLRRRRRRRSL